MIAIDRNASSVRRTPSAFDSAFGTRHERSTLTFGRGSGRELSKEVRNARQATRCEATIDASVCDDARGMPNDRLYGRDRPDSGSGSRNLE